MGSGASLQIPSDFRDGKLIWESKPSSPSKSVGKNYDTASATLKPLQANLIQVAANFSGLFLTSGLWLQTFKPWTQTLKTHGRKHETRFLFVGVLRERERDIFAKNHPHAGNR